MKLQDLHPFDSAIVGLNNVYFIDYKGDFHINAPFIIAANKSISTGNTHVLMCPNSRRNCIVHQVRLLDAYYDDGIIYLLLQDIFSQDTFTIDQQIECPQNPCKWILIDFDFIVEELHTEVIKSYCGSCNVEKSDILTTLDRF